MCRHEGGKHVGLCDRTRNASLNADCYELAAPGKVHSGDFEEPVWGHNFNVVPDRVSFTLDRRTNPEEDFDVERNQLFVVIEQARSRGIACDVDILQEGRSAATDADGSLGRALASNVRDVAKERTFRVVSRCPRDAPLRRTGDSSDGIRPGTAYGLAYLALVGQTRCRQDVVVTSRRHRS